MKICLDHCRSKLLVTAKALVSPHLRPYVEPSDIVQQTLMEAHQEAGRLATLDERSYIAWLRRALRHNMLDAIKHLKRQKHDIRPTVRTSEISQSRDGFGRLEISAATSPSQVALRNEQAVLLLAAIESLPENQRIAIIMKHLNGDSLKEVSERLGLSEPATAGLLHRGRQLLSKRMGEA